MFCCAIVVSFLPSKFCPPLPFALMCPAFAARYLEAPSNLSSIALCTYVSSFCCPVFGGQCFLFSPVFFPPMPFALLCPAFAARHLEADAFHLSTCYVLNVYNRSLFPFLILFAKKEYVVIEYITDNLGRPI